MMNTVFALAANGMSWSERASTAGSVALQGMLAIFAVLAILWAAVEIMHKCLNREEKEKTSEQPSKALAAAVPNNPDAAIAAAIAASLAACEDDGAVVAAITAAITAARAEEGNDTPFRVVAFKRAASNAKRRF